MPGVSQIPLSTIAMQPLVAHQFGAGRHELLNVQLQRIRITAPWPRAFTGTPQRAFQRLKQEFSVTGCAAVAPASDGTVKSPLEHCNPR
jgi:hypothetical protein